jgi:hypothetical protein
LDGRISVVPQAKPGQILENALDELGAASSRIEILDPEQESSAAGPGERMAQGC